MLRPSPAGELATTLWNELLVRFPGIDLDAFVVMPNHIHGIIILPDRAIAGGPLSPSKSAIISVVVGARTEVRPTIGKVVGAFKSLFTVEYIRSVKNHRWPEFDRRIWQRNYYEHVIRDEPDLNRVRRYVEENPLSWELDDENPHRVQEGGHERGRPQGPPLRSDVE
jgi:REP element-mobilizing transposase RayT